MSHQRDNVGDERNSIALGSGSTCIALRYARHGWPVLPLWWPKKEGCACGAKDCGSPGKHPLGSLVPHGVKEASKDQEILTGWWRLFPQANVGVATGPVSGLLVMDLDPRHGGRPEFLPGPIPRTPTVRTGSGGWHIYLAWPGSVKHLPKVLPGSPGVDLKGSGGYVVAPPSVHVHGNRYRWEISPEDTSLAVCPDWLLAAIAKTSFTKILQEISFGTGGAYGTPYGRAALRRELARLAETPQGNRNNALNRASFMLGKLVALGHLQESLVADLLYMLGGYIGLGEHEVKKTIRSGLNAGIREGLS